MAEIFTLSFRIFIILLLVEKCCKKIQKMLKTFIVLYIEESKITERIVDLYAITFT